MLFFQMFHEKFEPIYNEIIRDVNFDMPCKSEVILYMLAKKL